MIEIDGTSHDQKQMYDALRQDYLESLHLKVFRIADFDVKHNLPIIMKDLENFIISDYQY